MMQITVSRRQLMVFVAAVAMVVSVAWVGVAQRASAASATPVVYVATGENFPDALGSAAASAVQGGPVLLITRDSIPAVTAAELSRLAPDVIYVSGGTAVVSDAVFNQLKAYAPSVIRVAGANRYETAVEVSKSAFPATGGGGTAALEARVAELEALLAGVSRDGSNLLFTGMNLQIVNGQDATVSSNSVGNVIIGYNEDTGNVEARNGSHYLIIGDEHSYTGYAGIVAGLHNASSGPYASVLAGKDNSAEDSGASVSGGSDNTAAGRYASVSGGFMNTASGKWASVSGGTGNNAAGDSSSILGGDATTTPLMNELFPPFCECL